MRLHHVEILASDAVIEAGKEYRTIMDEIADAIARIVWPPGSKEFTILPIRKENGVKPIKERFVLRLEEFGWEAERRIDLGVTEKRPGPIDVVKRLADGRYFAVEWETGNISSSHRALNKMVIGLQRGVLMGGVLVLPIRRLYRYLTDRVGNYEELEPYFNVWRTVPVSGVLAVIAVDYDATSDDVPKIEKGTDGRALR